MQVLKKTMENLKQLGYKHYFVSFKSRHLASNRAPHQRNISNKIERILTYTVLDEIFITLEFHQQYKIIAAIYRSILFSHADMFLTDNVKFLMF